MEGGRERRQRLLPHHFPNETANSTAAMLPSLTHSAVASPMVQKKRNHQIHSCRGRAAIRIELKCNLYFASPPPRPPSPSPPLHRKKKS